MIKQRTTRWRAKHLHFWIIRFSVAMSSVYWFLSCLCVSAHFSLSFHSNICPKLSNTPVKENGVFITEPKGVLNFQKTKRVREYLSPEKQRRAESENSTLHSAYGSVARFSDTQALLLILCLGMTPGRGQKSYAMSGIESRQLLAWKVPFPLDFLSILCLHNFLHQLSLLTNSIYFIFEMSTR